MRSNDICPHEPIPNQLDYRRCAEWLDTSTEVSHLGPMLPRSSECLLLGALLVACGSEPSPAPSPADPSIPAPASSPTGARPPAPSATPTSEPTPSNPAPQEPASTCAVLTSCQALPAVAWSEIFHAPAGTKIVEVKNGRVLTFESATNEHVVYEVVQGPSSPGPQLPTLVERGRYGSTFTSVFLSFAGLPVACTTAGDCTYPTSNGPVTRSLGFVPVSIDGTCFAGARFVCLPDLTTSAIPQATFQDRLVTVGLLWNVADDYLLVGESGAGAKLNRANVLTPFDFGLSERLIELEVIGSVYGQNDWAGRTASHKLAFGTDVDRTGVACGVEVSRVELRAESRYPFLTTYGDRAITFRVSAREGEPRCESVALPSGATSASEFTCGAAKNPLAYNTTQLFGAPVRCPLVN